MPFPPFFRRLFGDNPVKPYKIRKELLPLDVDVVETFRKSLIGCLIPTTMATLPSCLGIPDGSLFLFEDYPELKEKYDAGGFNGMLLESTATSEEKDAWRGKWIKHPQGLGLYAPRLQGLFLRNATIQAEDGGKYNAPGLPNVVGSVKLQPDDNAFSQGKVTALPLTSGALDATWGGYGHTSDIGFFPYNISGISVDASKASSVYGSSDTVMPASADMAVGLYLGRPAEV